jgi:hypothetical protein
MVISVYSGGQPINALYPYKYQYERKVLFSSERITYLCELLGRERSD